MEIIWYNPEYDHYQKGNTEEYKQLIANHPFKESFKIAFEFNSTSVRLIDKIFASLSLHQNSNRLPSVSST